MVIIIAPLVEKTINNVCEWLTFYKKAFYRIESLSKENFDQFNEKLLIEASAFWSRKWILKFDVDNISDSKLQNYLSNEWQILGDYLVKSLEEKRHLGNYFLQTPNKILHLKLAKKIGLKTPNTLITSNKINVVEFQGGSNIITKSIKDSFMATYENVYFYNSTERVNKSLIENLEDSFYPSLFQEEIEKLYELRIIFVNNRIWTVAIFSQNDAKAVVDWRNFNHKKPIRIVPFYLPISIEKKVKRFVKMSGLNIGAIDMIVSKNNEFIFLECNPNGEIGMSSERCNFYIEKYIAKFLSNEENERSHCDR